MSGPPEGPSKPFSECIILHLADITVARYRLERFRQIAGRIVDQILEIAMTEHRAFRFALMSPMTATIRVPMTKISRIRIHDSIIRIAPGGTLSRDGDAAQWPQVAPRLIAVAGRRPMSLCAR